MKFLIAIPAFNEADRLPVYFPNLVTEVSRKRIPARFVLVDDGSSPEQGNRMEAICREIAGDGGASVEYHRLCINQGKGGAVYAGWDLARDETQLAFVDADGSIPAREVCRLLQYSCENSELALFSSRVKMRGRRVERTIRRHLMGRLYSSLVGCLIDPDVYDTQCGFKIVPRTAYLKVRALLSEQRFAFDIELLAGLNHFGVPVQECPIDWHECPGSKVSFVRDPLQMAGAVFRVSQVMKKWEGESYVE